ncbi:MAG: anti-sigma factor [Saprospiraceae bacterium]
MDARQAKEVEQMAAQHPEIKSEIASIEDALQRYALLHQTPPPQGTLTNILESIRNHPKASAGKVGTPTSAVSSWMWLLLIGALAGAAFFWYKWNDENKQRMNTVAELEELKKNCNQTDSTNQLLYAKLDQIQSSDNKVIPLESTGLVASAKAVVYYNEKDQKTYLNPDKLPEPPSGKQYQLWAIVAGAPVSMGVFDLNEGLEKVVEVPFIEEPQAFAITLEDAGGVPSPTMDQMYVMGQI